MGAELLRHPAEAWTPQPGPQTTFAETEADVAIIGGSPGGGKSVALLYEFAKLTQLRGSRRVRGTAFRRTEVALEKGGSLWDRAKEMLPAFGGRVLEDAKQVQFEASSGQIEHQHRIDFTHLHALGSERVYDGSEQDIVLFDELQDFDESQFFYMVSRMRSTKALRWRIRASCNAEPDSWLSTFLDAGGWIGSDGYIRPERSGVVRRFARNPTTGQIEFFDSAEEAFSKVGLRGLTFTFVLARTTDNRLLASDEYRDQSLSALLPAQGIRLFGDVGEDRGGNWLNADAAGEWFARDAIRFLDAPPSRIVRTVRGWDFGSIASDQTDWRRGPDWTEGARVSWCESGDVWIDDVASDRLGPLETDELLVRTSIADGPLVKVGIFQDAGSAGKRDAENTKALVEKERLTAEIVRSDRRADERDASASTLRSSKKARSSLAKQALARPWAQLAKQGRVCASNRLSAQAKEKLRVQTHRFPNGPKDDLIDAISCAVQVLDVGTVSTVDAIGQRSRLEADALAKAKAAADAKDAAWREEQARERPVIDVEAWAREHGRRT